MVGLALSPRSAPRVSDRTGAGRGISHPLRENPQEYGLWHDNQRSVWLMAYCLWQSGTRGHRANAAPVARNSHHGAHGEHGGNIFKSMGHVSGFRKSSDGIRRLLGSSALPVPPRGPGQGRLYYGTRLGTASTRRRKTLRGHGFLGAPSERDHLILGSVWGHVHMANLSSLGPRAQGNQVSFGEVGRGVVRVPKLRHARQFSRRGRRPFLSLIASGTNPFHTPPYLSP